MLSVQDSVETLSTEEALTEGPCGPKSLRVVEDREGRSRGRLSVILKKRHGQVYVSRGLDDTGSVGLSRDSRPDYGCKVGDRETDHCVLSPGNVRGQTRMINLPLPILTPGHREPRCVYGGGPRFLCGRNPGSGRSLPCPSTAAVHPFRGWSCV